MIHKHSTLTARFILALLFALTLAGSATFAADNTGLYGGGSCSVWQKIKSALTGVYCGYL